MSRLNRETSILIEISGWYISQDQLFETVDIFLTVKTYFLTVSNLRGSIETTSRQIKTPKLRFFSHLTYCQLVMLCYQNVEAVSSWWGMPINVLCTKFFWCRLDLHWKHFWQGSWYFPNWMFLLSWWCTPDDLEAFLRWGCENRRRSFRRCRCWQFGWRQWRHHPQWSWHLPTKAYETHSRWTLWSPTQLYQSYQVWNQKVTMKPFYLTEHFET